MRWVEALCSTGGIYRQGGYHGQNGWHVSSCKKIFQILRARNQPPLQIFLSIKKVFLILLTRIQFLIQTTFNIGLWSEEKSFTDCSVQRNFSIQDFNVRLSYLIKLWLSLYCAESKRHILKVPRVIVCLLLEIHVLVENKQKLATSNISLITWSSMYSTSFICASSICLRAGGFFIAAMVAAFFDFKVLSWRWAWSFSMILVRMRLVRWNTFKIFQNHLNQKSHS